MKHTYITLLCVFVFGLGAHAQPTAFPVQSEAHILYNLHEFVLLYEDALNHDLRRAESYLYKQNIQTELYNDLPGGSGYVNWLQYRSTIEDTRARRENVVFRHFRLEIAHIHNYGAYDVIQANVTREINEIAVELTISFIHFKYESHYQIADRFKILKVEKRGDSYLPYAWHKPLIPDNASFQAGSIVNEPRIDEGEWPVSGDLSTGYQAAFDVGYRIGGGREYAFLLKSGLGFSFLRSEYGSDDLNIFYDAIDRDNDAYEHEIIATSLAQDLSLGFIDVPVGLTWRYFFPNKIKLELEGGLKASYLLSQNLSVLDGTITHQGHYDLHGHSFTLYDLPSYGFGTWDAQAGSDMKDFNQLAFSLYGSLTYSHPVSEYVNIFISPYIRYGFTDLQNNKQIDEFALGPGNVGSLTMLTDGFNMLSYGARFGVKFSINNIDKNYLPSVRFKREENRLRSRPATINYASKASIMPGDLRISVRDAARARHRVKLTPVSNACVNQPDMNRFPDYIPYTSRNDSLVIYKPFGYNIYPKNRHFSTDMDNEILARRLVSTNPLREELAITPLAPFNLFIVKLSDVDWHGEEIIVSDYVRPADRILRSLVADVVDGECGYYLFHTDDQAGFASRQTDCHSCRESDIRLLLDHYTANRDKMLPANWLEELKNIYPLRTNARRNIINLHFVGSFGAEIMELIIITLDEFPKEYVNEINFHLFDIEEITRLSLTEGYFKTHMIDDFDDFEDDYDQAWDDFDPDAEVEEWGLLPVIREYIEKRPVELKNIRFHEISSD